MEEKKKREMRIEEMRRDKVGGRNEKKRLCGGP